MHTNNELRSEMNAVQLENTAVYLFIHSFKHEPEGIFTVFVISLIKVPLTLASHLRSRTFDFVLAKSYISLV